MKTLSALILAFVLFAQAQTSDSTLQIGSFNMEWFPCKDNGAMMRQYGINLSHPPQGAATDIQAMFQLLKKLDIELLAVVEIVDPDTLEKSAQRYLGPSYRLIYAPSASSQKVGFLYDSNVLQVIGKPQIYNSVTLRPHSWLRPALRVYFKVKPNGMDFHAVVTHLKAAPSGWKIRYKQWHLALKNILSELVNKSTDHDVILMGDFNNVSKLGYDEMLPVINELHFTWLTKELVDKKLYTDYWMPDPVTGAIQGSIIDHMFISPAMVQEYIPHSTAVGGMCQEGKKVYQAHEIPFYYHHISDHCPIFATFKCFPDDD